MARKLFKVKVNGKEKTFVYEKSAIEWLLKETGDIKVLLHTEDYIEEIK